MIDNPFLKRTLNLTQQAILLKNEPQKAAELKDQAKDYERVKGYIVSMFKDGSQQSFLGICSYLEAQNDSQKIQLRTIVDNMKADGEIAETNGIYKRTAKLKTPPPIRNGWGW